MRSLSLAACFARVHTRYYTVTPGGYSVEAAGHNHRDKTPGLSLQ